MAVVTVGQARDHVDISVISTWLNGILTPPLAAFVSERRSTYRVQCCLGAAEASPDGAGERAITSHRDSVLNWKLGLDFWGKRLLDYSSLTSHLHFHLQPSILSFQLLQRQTVLLYHYIRATRPIT